MGDEGQTKDIGWQSVWGRREVERTRRRNEGKWGLPVGIGIEIGWQRRRGYLTN